MSMSDVSDRNFNDLRISRFSEDKSEGRQEEVKEEPAEPEALSFEVRREEIRKDQDEGDDRGLN